MYFSLSEEIRKYPFVRLCIPFIVGIVLAIKTELNYLPIIILLIVSTISFLILKFKTDYKFESLKGLLINLILILSGFLLSSTKSDLYKNDNLNSYEGYITGKIISDPIISDKTVKISLEVEAIKQNDAWYKTTGRTLLYLSADEKSVNLKPGNYIIFSPQLSEIQNKGNPEEFDYRKYLSYNFIYTSDFLNSDSWELLSNKTDKNIRFRLLNFRQDLISILENNGMQEDELGVISALALGYRDRLNEEIRHNYASSGAMHILAVSGLHVGIIYLIIVFLLSFIRSKKLIWIKVVLTILFIWFYAFLTGLSPSVSRAATMFSFIAASQIFNRKTGIFNSIAASAFLLLLINPFMITQIGFQLSYLAVLGIVLIYPSLHNLLVFNNFILKWFWSLTAVSISAQIAVAPISIFYFNQISNYFLLTNYLLIPLASVAIYLCLTIFVLSPFEVISTFFTDILSKIVSLMNYFTSIIESLPGAVSKNLYINLPQLVFLYLFIIFTGYFLFESKKYKHLVISFVFIGLFFGTSLIRNIQQIGNNFIIVYNINRTTAINLIDGDDNILFAALSDENLKQIDYSAKNNWLKMGVKNEKFIDINRMNTRNILSNITTLDNRNVFQKENFIAFKDKRLLIINKNFELGKMYSKSEEKKLEIDYIILSDNSRISLSDISTLFNFDKIIIDSSNSAQIAEAWENENEELELNIHNVRRDGAFIVSL